MPFFFLSMLLVVVTITRVVAIVDARIRIVAANAVPSQSYRPRGQRVSGSHQILKRPVPQRHFGQIPVGATLGDHAECDANEGTPPYRASEYCVEGGGGRRRRHVVDVGEETRR
jgi:hypothetical protein